MHRSPPKSTVDEIPRSALPAPNDIKSPAPTMVVAVWCDMVQRMDRAQLDRFTRATWRRFDAGDLEPLKWAILRRRRVLAMQLRP